MLSAILLALAAPNLVVSQSAEIANCTTASWTSNAKQQSPCLVAAALAGACDGGASVVTPLPPNSVYSRLSGTSNKCSCSSVTYSMFSACAICQDRTSAPWPGWIGACDPGDVSITSFPLTIPTAVTVPAWAYMNVSETGIFDATAAEIEADAHTSPDSSAAPAPTHTDIPTSSSLLSAGPVSASSSSLSSAGPASASSSSPSSSSSHHSNAGPIAGATVGGLLSFCLIGALLYFRHRRSNNGSADGDKVEEYTVVHPLDDKGDSAANGGGRESQLGVREVILPGFSFNTAPPPRLYDPDDPSTFPPTPHPTGSHMHTHTLSNKPIPGHGQGPFGLTTTATTSNMVTTQTHDQSHDRNLSNGTTGGISAVPEI